MQPWLRIRDLKTIFFKTKESVFKFQVNKIAFVGGSGCRSQRGVIFPNYLHPRAPDLPILPATPPATDTPAQVNQAKKGQLSIAYYSLC